MGFEQIQEKLKEIGISNLDINELIRKLYSKNPIVEFGYSVLMSRKEIRKFVVINKHYLSVKEYNMEFWADTSRSKFDNINPYELDIRTEMDIDYLKDLLDVQDNIVFFPWAWGFVRRNYDAHSSKFTGFRSNPMDKVWFYFVSGPSQEINEYIQDLPEDAFLNNANQRKNALSEKLDEVDELIYKGDYEEAINKLQNDIRTKCDGFFGSSPWNDWITDYEAQQELVEKIDDLIAYLRTLI